MNINADTLLPFFESRGIKIWGTCDIEKIRTHIIPLNRKIDFLKNARSVISFAFPYKIQVKKRNISYYAIGPDYHKIIMLILSEICDDLASEYKNFYFLPFCDNTVIPEVRAAIHSGLGVLGKNGLLINEIYGSWVFLAEIVTNLQIKHRDNVIKFCLNCGICEKLCPGNALCGGKLNKERCLSHISQKKGKLTVREEILLKKGNLIWGCDVCQEVCPANSKATVDPFFALKKPKLEWLSEENYHLYKDRAFFWRPKQVIERNLKLFN
ncbi:MAG: DUF1730 domain-containing protein [Oscillospiraceae bacterium]|jgi:epoxyqueuosine reductase|nr:DUF1730 domain-containing protein [Oscillospiraceae bacterium]